jgi:hypothetical protein
LSESVGQVAGYFPIVLKVIHRLFTPLLSNNLPFSAATMNDETIEFLWLAQKDCRVSLMTVGSDKHVFHLQILIHEAGKNGVFRDTDARDVVLWMLNDPEPMDPPYTFAGHIAKGRKLSDLATELKLATVMSEVFTEPPMRGYLYIIADIPDPDTRKRAHSPDSSSSVKHLRTDSHTESDEQELRAITSYAPREATVSGIYTKLQHHKYLQVFLRLNS